jgi:hypothetical protein
MNVRRVVPDFRAEDPAASAEFYAGVLGLEPSMDLGWIVTFAAPRNPSAQISVMRGRRDRVSRARRLDRGR